MIAVHTPPALISPKLHSYETALRLGTAAGVPAAQQVLQVPQVPQVGSGTKEQHGDGEREQEMTRLTPAVEVIGC